MRHESALERSHRSLPPPWDRIFSLGTRFLVWTLLFGILYILRPFFLLIFLTFVFAYIQAHGVDGLQARIKNRVARAVLVALVLLGFLGAVGYFLAPRLTEQVQEFAGSYTKHLDNLNKTVRALPDNLQLPTRYAEQLESFEISEILDDLLGFGVAEEPGAAGDAGAAHNVTRGPAQREALRHSIEKLQSLAGNLLSVGGTFLLSLLFSFLIVLDLPGLVRSVLGLRNTKVGFIYDEVADNIQDFGRVLGTALEAQLFIAIANTILTAIGLWAMGLPGIVFLATIVFFGSFIPVAGVFLSSTPICLVALQISGVKLMLVAIILILVIHFIEAYFLNPRIFGHHFRMNAVLVLIVLTVGGKLFGIWGLVLGLPVVNYFFAHAIRYAKDEDLADPGPPPPAAVTN